MSYKIQYVDVAKRSGRFLTVVDTVESIGDVISLIQDVTEIRPQGYKYRLSYDVANETIVIDIVKS